MANDPDISKLHSMMDRAQKLSEELAAIYKRDLAVKVVSDEAVNITHEIIEKCCNALDQAMTLFAYREIYPLISERPKKGGYFPASRNENAYRSTMGQWGASNLAEVSPAADAKLRSLQPFSNSANTIYASIRDFAAEKHTSLLPQRRIENAMTRLTRPDGGSVRYSSELKFGEGIRIMGAYIDHETNMPYPNQNIGINVETWVSFVIEGSDQNALTFCLDAINATRAAFRVLHPPG